VADTAGQVREALRDRYLLERELGQGGMATVYLAHDLKHDRDVALKVLRPELAAVLGRERFLAEIRLTAKLDHPHILTLIDSGESDGLLWYVVPFIRGESLRQRLQREKQLGVEEALAIAKQVAGALEYAHRHGVIHRDLKPENILLHEGEAMLADFGIALAVREAGGNRLTETGLSLGTPQYMSPEQATGDRQLDARSDVYSLGAVLYEMLAGEPPHTGATVQAVIAKLMTERPTRLKTVRDTVPEGVDAAVARALAKVPADRFSSAAGFVSALARPELPKQQLPISRKGTPGARWAAAGALIALGALGIAYLRRPNSRPAAPDYRRVQLTTSGEAHTPVLSPDGSQVAYAARDCPDGGACVWSIVVRETTTGVERPIIGNLVEPAIQRWSPNGLWLLYQTLSPGGTYSVPRIGGSATRLGFGPADFLPSGDTALVAAGWRADKTLWLRLFALPSSQPSDSLAVEVPRRALALTSLSVAPNGRWFALAWVDVTGAGMISLHNHSGKLADSLPMDSPQSLRWVGSSKGLLLPMKPREGLPTDGALVKIAVAPATGRLGPVDTLVIAPGSGSWPRYDLSADGRSLVYALAREGESVVWTLERPRPPSPPQPLRRVLTSSRQLDAYVTRDGRNVLYSMVTQVGSQEGARWYVAPFEGGPARAVTPAIADAIGFSATDGRRLFIATRAAAARGRITAYDLVTGRATPFAEQPTDRFTIWTGVRGGIAVLSGSGDSLQLLDSLGRVIFRTGFSATVGRRSLVASSPDGTELALAPFASPEPNAEGNYEGPLYRISAASGRPRFVARMWGGKAPWRPFVWTNDGWLHYVMWSTASDPRPLLYRVRADGGEQEVESQLPFGRDGLCSISGDGRRWVCVVNRQLSDLYLMRNFDPEAR
jgi:serine/threonine protein kinase